MRSRVTALPIIVVSAAATFVAAVVSADNAHDKSLLEAGQIQEAITNLRQTTQQTPKDADAWGLLGEAYLRSQKSDSAEIAAKQLLALEDDWSLGYALLARAQLGRGDAKGAYETVKQGLKKSEKRRAMKKESSGPILAAQGLTLLAIDSTDQAVIVLTQAREEDPSNALVVEALGDAYFKRGVPALAVVQYETAVQMDSSDATRNYKLAQAYLKDKRFNEAARAYERSIKMNPENTAAILDLAKIYNASKHYKESVPILAEYVKREPSSLEGWTLYMQALSNTNHPEELLQASQKVLELQPGSHDALRAQGRAQSELKHPEEAIATFQKLAAVDTLAAEDYQMLGKAYSKTGQDSLARVNLELAMSKTPEGQPELYNDLGFTYMRLQMFDKAADMYKKRIDADSTAVAAYLNYGLCNLFLKRYDLAGPALQKVIALKPDYAPAYTTLAKYYLAVDSTARAIDTYQKVIDLVGTMPDSSQAKYRKDLAEAYGQIGYTHLAAKPPRLEDALNALTRSIKIKDDDAQVRLWRAQTYATMNRRDEAIQEYKAVQRLDPENKKGLFAKAKEDLELFKQ